jgi:hypothetical protein
VFVSTVDDQDGRIIYHPAIKNDSSEMILSEVHSSVHALGDKIQHSYQRRE